MVFLRMFTAYMYPVLQKTMVVGLSMPIILYTYKRAFLFTKEELFVKKNPVTGENIVERASRESTHSATSMLAKSFSCYYNQLTGAVTLKEKSKCAPNVL